MLTNQQPRSGSATETFSTKNADGSITYKRVTRTTNHDGSVTEDVESWTTPPGASPQAQPEVATPFPPPLPGQYPPVDPPKTAQQHPNVTTATTSRKNDDGTVTIETIKSTVNPDGTIVEDVIASTTITPDQVEQQAQSLGMAASMQMESSPQYVQANQAYGGFSTAEGADLQANMTQVPDQQHLPFSSQPFIPGQGQLDQQQQQYHGWNDPSKQQPPLGAAVTPDPEEREKGGTLSDGALSSSLCTPKRKKAASIIAVIIVVGVAVAVGVVLGTKPSPVSSTTSTTPTTNALTDGTKSACRLPGSKEDPLCEVLPSGEKAVCVEVVSTDGNLNFAEECSAWVQDANQISQCCASCSICSTKCGGHIAYDCKNTEENMLSVSCNCPTTITTTTTTASTTPSTTSSSPEEYDPNYSSCALDGANAFCDTVESGDLAVCLEANSAKTDCAIWIRDLAPKIDICCDECTMCPDGCNKTYSFDCRNLDQDLFYDCDCPPELVRTDKIYFVTQSVSGETVLDSSTPQSQALEWLLDDSFSDPLPSEDMIAQRYIVALLYFALDGSNWLNSTGYLSNSSECDWYGINCSSANVVVELNLGENNLVGPLLKELSHLSHLEVLEMHQNELTGLIDDAFGEMLKLSTLGLGGNLISGAIPDSLGNLINLEMLLLWGNRLTSSLPASLGKLVNLKDLWLNNNTLAESIPDSFGGMVALEKLVMWGNEFTGSLPETLGSLQNLKAISLGDNRFAGELPSFIGGFPALEELYLGPNGFTGRLPNSLSKLSNLAELWLVQNEFSGELPDPSNWKKMKNLVVWGNKLSGTLSGNLGQLVNIVSLALQRNEFVGQILSTLGQLTNMKELFLYSNKLTGTVPASICALPLENFWADCAGSNPEVECPCCTTCVG